MKPLSKTQARNLTKKIKENLQESAQLMKEAHEKKVWLPLGYKNFSQWLREAVGITRGRAYQLINIAQLDQDIREKLPLPNDYTISDKNTRAVMSYGRDLFLSEVEKTVTEDEQENMYALEKLFSKIKKASKETSEATTSVEGETTEILVPEKDAVDTFADTFFNQYAIFLDTLPQVEEVAEGRRTELVAKYLKPSLEHIERAMKRYKEALA